MSQEGSSTYDVIGGEFCFCYFFARESLSPQENGSSSICKHILAVKLGEALTEGTSGGGVVIEKEIEDRDFAPLML